MAKPAGEVTGLLRDWGAGDQAALERLTPLIYGELHAIAHRSMKREAPGNTLQTTALIHEAFLKLVHAGGVQWQDRAHFCAVSAQVMRRILVDAARARHTAKRCGGVTLRLDENLDASPERGRELIALDDALDQLARVDPRKAKVVELRFFGGLTVEETAEALKISTQSVLRDWKLARAWLMQEISGSLVNPARPDRSRRLKVPPESPHLGQKPTAYGPK